MPVPECYGVKIRLQGPEMAKMRLQILSILSTNSNRDYSGETEDKQKAELEKKAWPDEDFFFFLREVNKITEDSSVFFFFK